MGSLVERGSQRRGATSVPATRNAYAVTANEASGLMVVAGHPHRLVLKSWITVLRHIGLQMTHSSPKEYLACLHNRDFRNHI